VPVLDANVHPGANRRDTRALVRLAIDDDQTIGAPPNEAETASLLTCDVGYRQDSNPRRQQRRSNRVGRVGRDRFAFEGQFDWLAVGRAGARGTVQIVLLDHCRSTPEML
jgi:hypothetical protein